MELVHDQNASQKDPICRYMQQLDQISPTISYKKFDNKNIMVKYIVKVEWALVYLNNGAEWKSLRFES